jgi:hypothetical protein
MRRGWRAANSSSLTPWVAAAVGPKVWMRMSAPSSSPCSSARPSAVSRSRTTLRLERFQVRKPVELRVGSPPGRSTLITSAPASARRRAATAPAMFSEQSITRRPSRIPGAPVPGAPFPRPSGPDSPDSGVTGFDCTVLTGDSPLLMARSVWHPPVAAGHLHAGRTAGPASRTGMLVTSENRRATLKLKSAWSPDQPGAGRRHRHREEGVSSSGRR